MLFACVSVSLEVSTASYSALMPDELPPRVRSAVVTRLRTGEAVQTVAEELGVTTATVYPRRRHDAGFAAAMDQATTTRTPEPAGIATDAQWIAFYEHLAVHGVLRQAALAAGIRPEAVYDRRRTDTGFAKQTDQLRAGPE